MENVAHVTIVRGLFRRFIIMAVVEPDVAEGESEALRLPEPGDRERSEAECLALRLARGVWY